jgi:hypothetical protein
MSTEKARAFKQTLAELREAIAAVEAVAARSDPSDLGSAPNLFDLLVGVEEFVDVMHRLEAAIVYMNAMREQATRRGLPPGSPPPARAS